MSKPTIQTFGADGLLLTWAHEIHPEIHKEVLEVERILWDKFEDQIIETVCTYQSLAVYFRNKMDASAIEKALEGLQLSNSNPSKPSTVWEVPVCYSEPFGLDLEGVSQQLGLPVNEIIALHTETVYRVYFTGFMPGFLYLGGLNSKLHCPRKTNPRRSVFSGAVGIGGKQTGVYPMESPGGWNILGRTPISLFDVNAQPPVEIKAGDEIQFVPISTSEYDAIARLVASGAYSLSNTARS